VRSAIVQQPVALVEHLVQHAQAQGSEFAVGDLSVEWTFHDLAAHAAGLAAQLMTQGAASPVVVLVDRHPPSVAALFGVLWSGRGAVPLSAAEPTARLLELIERVGASLVVDATESGVAGLGDAGSLRSLTVQRLPQPLSDSASWPEAVPADPMATGLIIFTSGSTGRPKGVLRTMGDLNTLLDVSLGLPGFVTPLRSVATLPLHFVGGFANVIIGLSGGRPTVLIDPALASPVELVKRCNELRVERISIGASVLRALGAVLGPGEAIPTLREVWPAGEPLDWGDVALVRQTLSRRATVVNPYGSTEILGMAALNWITADVPIGEGRLPLGRAVNRSGCRIEPLGDDPRLGELVVRGEVVTGYFDDIALSDSRFGVDADGVRFLRTGDVVFQDDDGVLHHRGRVDDMVKINGKLVEPAESEAALCALARCVCGSGVTA